MTSSESSGAICDEEEEDWFVEDAFAATAFAALFLPDVVSWIDDESCWINVELVLVDVAAPDVTVWFCCVDVVVTWQPSRIVDVALSRGSLFP